MRFMSFWHYAETVHSNENDNAADKQQQKAMQIFEREKKNHCFLSPFFLLSAIDYMAASMSLTYGFYDGNHHDS